MKVLATAEALSSELNRLIRECRKCEIAVAWASLAFDACRQLQKHSDKIRRMVVGTHFYQTHPDFIEAFLEHPNVRFVVKTDGVFHPKVYFFELAEGRWECIVGSPNLTQGGFGRNEELAVLVTSEDEGATQGCKSFGASLNRYWEFASPFSHKELASYREAWQRKQPLLKNLQGRFGNPIENGSDDGGKSPLEIPIVQQSWADFFKKVKSEQLTAYGHSMTARLNVIEAIQSLFADRLHLDRMEKSDRRKVAGLDVVDGVDFRFFGSMKGVGVFQQAVNKNDSHLSSALDVIPPTGIITREMYLSFIAEYKKAFHNGRDGVPTASRLLAMKRPDWFVCLSKLNRTRLCADFGIKGDVGYEKYWDSIIERIREAMWWISPEPVDDIERRVWAARSAFLDSHYYEE